MAGPDAGWYDDPEHPGQQRWWDGQAWTDHRQPVPAATPSGASPGSTAGPATMAPPAAFSGPPATGAWGARPLAAPDAPDNAGQTLAIVSLVTGLLWLFWIGSLAAIVTGALALKRKVAGGHQVMAIVGIVLGLLGMASLAVVAFFGFSLFQLDRAVQEQLPVASVESDLRFAAVEMEMAYTDQGRYPAGSWTPIEQVLPGYEPYDGVELLVVWSDDTAFCLQAEHVDGAVAWYDSTAGGVTDTPC